MMFSIIKLKIGFSFVSECLQPFCTGLSFPAVAQQQGHVGDDDFSPRQPEQTARLHVVQRPGHGQPRVVDDVCQPLHLYLQLLAPDIALRVHLQEVDNAPLYRQAFAAPQLGGQELCPVTNLVDVVQPEDVVLQQFLHDEILVDADGLHLGLGSVGGNKLRVHAEHGLRL